MMDRLGCSGVKRWIMMLAFIPPLQAPSCSRELPPPNVILVSLDTTRADHISIMGYGRNTTPNLDELGRKGILFEEAVTVSNNTLIAHASMLTGLYPTSHGAIHLEGGVPLYGCYNTLAEDFAKGGYQTAGFTAHGDWLTERFGFDQGFDRFTSDYRSAEVVLDEALAWMAERDETRPYFLFIHLFDVHSDFEKVPYDSPAPFKGRYTAGYDGPLVPWEDQPVAGSRFLRAVYDGKIKVSEEDARYLRGMYDEGLAYTDDQLGRFFRALEPLENTYVVVTADHGEEFLEHGRMLHGSSYDEVVRVPLILVPPKRLRRDLGAPRRIRDQVSIVDLRPTLTALAGLPKPVGFQGVNLVPWLKGEVGKCPTGPVPLQQDRAVRFKGYKLIKGKKPELYNLTEDPGEQENLVGRSEMIRVVQFLMRYMNKQKEINEGIREAHARVAAALPLAEDPEAERRLRDLGYTK